MRRSLILTLNLLLVLGLSPNLFAQTVNSDLQQGYTTFGINAGKAYQSSDVKADPKGFGFGLTLGKNIFYRPGATFSFDLRSRLLYTQSYGLDRFKNHHIENDPAVNGTYGLNYLDYPEATGINDGFIISNHKTSHAELGGEAVLTLNELKERTGLKVSLYGGLGLDWYKVKINQADANGMPYYNDYANLNDAAPTSQVLDRLKTDILDDSYETNAGGFENGWGKAKVAPSVGAELGFQVTPKFSIDFGHRMTFTGRDNFDGDQWSEPGNDLLHYTYAGLNFNINKTAPRQRAPRINLLKPNRNVLTTNNTSLVIEADIDNVTSAADITFQVDGEDRGFSFRNDDFLANIYLSPGKHEIFLNASNAAGYDSEKITVFVEQDRFTEEPPVIWDRPPFVQFTSPTGGMYESNTNALRIEARVENITNKSQIRLWKDGKAIGFTFNQRNGEVRTDGNLRPGENLFKIQVRNNDGTATDEMRINYVEPIQAPRVTIRQPATDTRTRAERIEFIAHTDFVKFASDVSLLVNGRKTDFYFENGVVKTTLNLQDGNNFIEIEVRNPAGKDRDQVMVVKERETPVFYPPTVQIVRPINNLTTRESHIALVAEVDGIEDRRDLRLKVNNRAVLDFHFDGSRLTIDLRLVPGNNTIEVFATNRGGDASDRVNVRMERIIEEPDPVLPEVTISQPFNGKVFSIDRTTLLARVKHVRGKGNVEIHLNGSVFRNFDLRNNTINASLKLREGYNDIEVKVRNEDGTDTDRVRVVYRPKVRVEIPKPPVVSIISPADRTTVEKTSVPFEARVKEVNGKQNIRLTVNNRRLDFRLVGDKVSATLPLRVGSNDIRIEAENNDGKDAAGITVIMKEPLPAPSVRITRPANNSKVTVSEIDFAATVLHVDDRKNIKVLHNRKEVNFNFIPSTGKVVANLNLTKGANQIEIRVSNKKARALDKVKVSYIAKPDIKLPDEVVVKNKPEIDVISISQPTIDPTNPQNARSTMVAKLKFVDKSSDISFTVNGKAITNFLFASSGSFQVTFPVVPGRNKVVLKAVNAAGTTTVTRYVELGVNTGEGNDSNGTITKSESRAEPVKPANSSESGREKVKENKIKRRW
jgi:hypothetical protein